MKLSPAHFLLLFVFVALLAPVAFYAYQFGPAISSDHTRWAEMGNAVAGMYAPIIGCLTLLLLWFQHRTQTQQAHFMKVLHIHQSTTDSALRVLDKIEQYILENELGDHVTWLNSHTLDEVIEARNNYDRSDEHFRTLADLWSSFNVAFEGLSNIGDTYLSLIESRLIQAAYVQLGTATCSSLDAIAFIARRPIKHSFREELNSANRD